jgi:hypothetical protein
MWKIFSQGHILSSSGVSISINAQYVTLDNKIKCLSLAVFVFGNPTNKTGTAYTWELLIVNHLDQLLWSTNEKY